MRTFELLSGRHIDKDSGEEFVKDSKRKNKTVIVESELPLDKLFANKFKRLEGVTKRWRDEEVKPTTDKGGVGKVMDDSDDKKKDVDEKKNPRRVNKMKDVPTGDEDDVYRGDEDKVSKSSKVKDSLKKKKDEDEEEEVDFGEEVSDDFPKATDNGLQVFHKGKKFTVVDPERPAVALNKEDLTSNKEVKAFIKERMAKKSSKGKK